MEEEQIEGDIMEYAKVDKVDFNDLKFM